MRERTTWGQGGVLDGKKGRRREKGERGKKKRGKERKEKGEGRRMESHMCMLEHGKIHEKLRKDSAEEGTNVCDQINFCLHVCNHPQF